MDLKIELNQIQEYGARMISILGLHSQPVGVRLLTEQHQVPEGASLLEQHRYCQALMKARHGANVLLGAENLSCPAAASVFGFRPLPKGFDRQRIGWLWDRGRRSCWEKNVRGNAKTKTGLD